VNGFTGAGDPTIEAVAHFILKCMAQFRCGLCGDPARHLAIFAPSIWFSRRVSKREIFYTLCDECIALPDWAERAEEAIVEGELPSRERGGFSGNA
jgi:hypothetical protein